MDDSYFLSRLDDLARQAERTGVACTRFLSSAQQAQVQAMFAKRQDVQLQFDGGYDGAERKLAVLTEPNWGSYQRAEALCALRLQYRKQDTLTHRDVLGAAMALGIKRELIGDIEASQDGFLICTAEIAPYLMQELTQAGRVGLSLSVIDDMQLPAREQVMQELRDTVASLRFDGVVAAAFRISRTEAARAIEAGLVQRNHAPVLSVSKLVAQGDVLSYRGKGRAKILEVGGESRKGRIWITIGIYQ